MKNLFSVIFWFPDSGFRFPIPDSGSTFHFPVSGLPLWNGHVLISTLYFYFHCYFITPLPYSSLNNCFNVPLVLLISLFFAPYYLKLLNVFTFSFFKSYMGLFFTTQIHPAMLYTATSLCLYTSPYFNANYMIIMLLSMALILSCCLHLYAFTHLRMYASTLVRLYSSMHLRY